MIGTRAKLLAHDWLSGCLATAYAIEKLLPKIFCNNGARFEIVEEKYIEELKDKSENENTRKSTEYWKNVFKKWATERNFQANLEEYESDVLDQTLSQLYAESQKGNGDNYEPVCLKVMQISLERYLKSKSHPKSIIRDRKFLNSRKVLGGKSRKLREQGKRKRPNRSRSLTKEEEEVLWQNGQLGGGTSTSSTEHHVVAAHSALWPYKSDKNTTK